MRPGADDFIIARRLLARLRHPPRGPDDPALKAGRRTRDLAHRLIDTRAAKWKPEEFRDTYTEVRRKVIEAKVEGKELERPREERRRPVANLMKALEASLERKEPAKAAAQRT
jgi:DNA end-binding protein Ku